MRDPVLEQFITHSPSVQLPLISCSKAGSTTGRVPVWTGEKYEWSKCDVLRYDEHEQRTCTLHTSE